MSDFQQDPYHSIKRYYLIKFALVKYAQSDICFGCRNVVSQLEGIKHSTSVITKLVGSVDAADDVTFKEQRKCECAVAGPAPGFIHCSLGH